MNYQQLARELIDALRQEHSYLELSNKMRFSYDKVGKWVRGTRDIDWDEFVRFCDIVKAPLTVSLHRSIHFDKERDLSLSLAGFLLRDNKVKDVSDRLNMHPSRLRRIINGATATLAEILQIIDEFYPNRLQLFVELLADDYFHRLTCMDDHRSLAQHYLNLFRRDPRFAILIKLAATSKYRELSTHQTGFFAENLGITMTQEEQMLNELVQRGLMVIENQKYSPVDFQLTSLTSSEQHEMIKVFMMMSQQAYLTRKPGEIFSAMDLLVSDECYEQITKLFQDCFYKAKQMSQEDQGRKDRWRIVTLQMFEPSESLNR